MKIVRTLLIGLAVILVAGGAYAVTQISYMGKVGAGMAAHTLCTNVIGLGREFDEVVAMDIAPDQRARTRSSVDGDVVTTEFVLFGIPFAQTQAVYRPGLGCAVAIDASVEELRAQALPEGSIPSADPQDFPWPQIAMDVEGVDYPKLEAAIEGAFTEATDDNDAQQNTRAVLVNYKGNLIAERYGDGWSGDVPHRAMSMTKSVTSALIGMLVEDGKLNLNAPTGFEGWTDPATLKGKVKLEHIVQMTSGFEYEEGYTQIGPVPIMLFGSHDGAKYSASLELDKPAGSYWDYQTTNSAMLQRIIRDAIGDDAAYWRFAQERLFSKVGMTTAFLSADASGTFAGGALLYASPRDYMRFGLLYLNKGRVNGEQVLSEEWVEYTATASDASMERQAYGAQFWLNAPSADQWAPSLPEDMYAAKGHYGQYIVVIPSYDLVVVRNGITFAGARFDLDAMLEGIVDALPKPE